MTPGDVSDARAAARASRRRDVESSLHAAEGERAAAESHRRAAETLERAGDREGAIRHHQQAVDDDAAAEVDDETAIREAEQ